MRTTSLEDENGNVVWEEEDDRDDFWNERSDDDSSDTDEDW